MLGIAVILLFISAATCSTITSHIKNIPLSAPLPDGTVALQVNCSLVVEAQMKVRPETKCHATVPSSLTCLDLGYRGCCSDDEIMERALSPCWAVIEDDAEWAILQYTLNQIIGLCHFDGHSAVNVQYQLTPNASALLDSLNRLDEQLRQQQAIYRALQLTGGHIGLPILLLFSIFSKTAQRDLTFLNFCFTWIFASITFSVGLYRLGPASSFSGVTVTLPFIHSDQECLNQAALVSGAEAMTDTAMCALIIQLWFHFRAAIHGSRSPGQIRWTRVTLLVAPYMALLAFSLPALDATVAFFQFLSRGLGASQLRFYCILSYNNTFLIYQYTVLLAILIATLIFDASIIHILYCRWWFFQRTGEKALGIPLSVAFRVVIFCAYRLVIAVAYVATMLNAKGIRVLTSRPGVVRIAGVGEPIVQTTTSFIPMWVDMLQAGTPLVAFLIFGTNKEFLDALMFWRWFNPILATSMFRRRRSPVTSRESNTYGEVVNHESVVFGGSALDITQETKSTDECLPL